VKQQSKERSETMWEKQLCRHLGRWRRGGGGAPGAGAGIFPLQLMKMTMMRQAVPLQPMKVHSGADIHLPPVEDPTPDQGNAQRRLWPCGEPVLEQAPGRTYGPMGRGAHTGAGLLAGLVTLWGTHPGAVCERLFSMGRTHIGEVCGEPCDVGGTSRLEQGRLWGVPSRAGRISIVW